VRLARDALALGRGCFHRADLGLDAPGLRASAALHPDPLHHFDGERERGEDRHRDNSCVGSLRTLSAS
jgi:hypothetical protein